MSFSQFPSSLLNAAYRRPLVIVESKFGGGQYLAAAPFSCGAFSCNGGLASVF